MARATWRGVVLAESDATLEVERAIYFPPDSVHWEFLNESSTRTRCPWRGEAVYFHLRVEGNELADAAWCYPNPKRRASRLRDFVAFWKDIYVESDG